MIWLPENGNVYEIQTAYEIEATKAEISYAEIGISNVIAKMSTIDYNVAVLKANISYLKKSARIVSMKEYLSVIFQLAGLLEQKTEKQATLKDLKRKKEELHKKLKLLDIKMEQVRFKVLEFKKRG